MGCDIHCFVETRNKNMKWEKATGFKNDYYDPKDPYFSKEEYLSGDNILEGRNYREFAILANVRNGSYAGCDVGDRIEPISMPKGEPSDVCEEIKEQIELWNGDGHSHSYLTAKEISEYDKNITVKQRGYVNAQGYKEFLKNGDPDSWCGDVSGGSIAKVENDECISFQEKHPDLYVWTKIEWEQTAGQLAPWLFGGCLTQLMERSKNGTGDDVRIVFWFDN